MDNFLFDILALNILLLCVLVGGIIFFHKKFANLEEKQNNFENLLMTTIKKIQAELKTLTTTSDDIVSKQESLKSDLRSCLTLLEQNILTSFDKKHSDLITFQESLKSDLQSSITLLEQSILTSADKKSSSVLKFLLDNFKNIDDKISKLSEEVEIQ